MIIKTGVIGHFLAFLEEKLHLKIEYSIAGFYVIRRKIGRKTLHIGLCPYDVAVNLRFKIIEISFF